LGAHHAPTFKIYAAAALQPFCVFWNTAR
jgi:hypothetical protein